MPPSAGEGAGLKLYLLCARTGCPHLVPGRPKIGEREVCLDLLAIATETGLLAGIEHLGGWAGTVDQPLAYVSEARPVRCARRSVRPRPLRLVRLARRLVGGQPASTSRRR